MQCASCLLVVLLVAAGTSSIASAEPVSGESSLERAASKKHDGGRKGEKLNPRLPDTFKELDRNGDNQIGLYEWNRARYDTFVSLDRNGDGFLTAKELAKSPSPGAESSGAMTKVRVEPDVPHVPTQSVNDQGAGFEPNSSLAETRINQIFRGIDRNNDDSISKEEWEKSGVRSGFMKSNIEVGLPLDQATFRKRFLMWKRVPESIQSTGNFRD